MPNEDDEEKPGPAKAIDQYCGTLRGLRTTFAITVPIVAAISVKQDKAFKTFLDEHGVEKKEDEDKIVYSLPLVLADKANRLRKRKEQLDVAYFHLPRALVVSLVSAYDAFLADLLKAIFANKPEMVEASARQFTFRELAAFGSIDAARTYLIEKEVEGLIRESHIKQFDWLENRFGIPLRKDLPSWSTFVEVTERRNLYVHADAVVSDQYLNNCSKHGVSAEALRPGDHLPALTSDYWLSAWRCLYEIGTKLGHVLWRKAIGDLKSSDDELIECIYDLLDDEDYELAAELGHFATRVLPKHSSAICRRTLLVNYCIALRFGGKLEKCCEVLNAEDWSDTDDVFQLANAVLMSDFDRAQEIMKQAGNNHKRLTRHNYERWPLFKEFRNSEKFLSPYRELFGQDYEVPEPKAGKADSQKKQTASHATEGAEHSLPGPSSSAEPNAPPNGGPATRIGNSGVVEGPPSVS